MVNNKWNNGKVRFSLDNLSPMYLLSPGLKTLYATLDPLIGNEVIFLIVEPKEYVDNYKERDIASFKQKVGLVNTTYGPVCFLLYYFPDPLTGQQITYENTLNPESHEQLAMYKALANQKYWHVINSDSDGNVVNFFEFPNKYYLNETLEQISDVCKSISVIDFMSAKAEYEQRYSISELLEA